MRAWWLVALATALPQIAVAQAPRPDAAEAAKTDARGGATSGRAVRRAGGEAGMVVTGEQEAPQVLFILPWQEPRPKPPPSVDAALGRDASSGGAVPAATGVASSRGNPGGDLPAASAASAPSVLPKAAPAELPPVVDFLRGIDQDPLSKPLPK